MSAWLVASLICAIGSLRVFSGWLIDWLCFYLSLDGYQRKPKPQKSRVNHPELNGCSAYHTYLKQYSIIPGAWHDIAVFEREIDAHLRNNVSITSLPNATKEIQTITLPGPTPATATEVQAELQPCFFGLNVTVTGDPGGPYIATFNNSFMTVTRLVKYNNSIENGLITVDQFKDGHIIITHSAENIVFL